MIWILERGYTLGCPYLPYPPPKVHQGRVVVVPQDRITYGRVPRIASSEEIFWEEKIENFMTEDPKTTSYVNDPIKHPTQNDVFKKEIDEN